MYGLLWLVAAVLIGVGTGLAVATSQSVVGAPAGVLGFAVAAVGYGLGYPAGVRELVARIRRARQGDTRGFQTRREDGLLVIEIQRTPVRTAIWGPFFIAMNTPVIDILFIPVALGCVIRGEPIDWNDLLSAATAIPGSISGIIFVVGALFTLPAAFRRATVEVGPNGLSVRQHGLLGRRIHQIRAEDLQEIEMTADGLTLRRQQGSAVRVDTNQPRSADEELRRLILTALQERVT